MTKWKKHKHYHSVVKNPLKVERVVNPDSRHPQSGKEKPSGVSKTVNLESWNRKIGEANYYIILAVILLLSLIIYFPILKNGFVWDDGLYIINNNLIKNLSWKGIKAIFSNFGGDNYAPLTDLIDAVQYKINGLSPAAFHFSSLVFHLVNISLVFWFIKSLGSRWDIAAITSILFGIHPMQVESVAWATGGSNLFCTTFFLGSLIVYLYYLKQGLKRLLLFSLFFFALSLLSKAVAVVLPIILLLIDYYKERIITIKVLSEKSPFIILSLAAGILSLLLKHQASAVSDLAVSPLLYRPVFASYAFINYLLKLIMPLNLSAFYPYPVRNIPVQYYAYPVLILGLIAGVLYSSRFSKKIIFGIGFFAVTIFLMLQLLPVGGAVMADRYSYIPFIGIFYLAGEGLVTLWRKKLKLTAIIVLCAFTILFSVKTYARCTVWNNDITLWNDVISHYKSAIACYNRGYALMNDKRYNEALNDYNTAIELKPDYADAYLGRGNIFLMEHRNDEALKDYNKAIELRPGYADIYLSRGTLFINEKKVDEALKDFNKAIELKPDYVQAYYDRGLLEYNSGKKDDACMDLKKAATLGFQPAEAILNRVCK